MVCAAKAGVLQEVLANQFKKTDLGEGLVAEYLNNCSLRCCFERSKGVAAFSSLSTVNI